MAACEGNPKSTILLAIRFPNIVSESIYENLNHEWRELAVSDIPALQPKELLAELEKFWYHPSMRQKI